MRHLALALAAVLGVGLAPPVAAQSTAPAEEPMKILVHITHGPEAPTRAVLGFHVAKAAVDEGHQVTVFLAGDGVQLMRRGTVDQLVGLGTGNLQELYDQVVASDARFYLSGGSSRARSLTEDDLDGVEVQFASPRELVRLAAEHDRMFVY